MADTQTQAPPLARRRGAQTTAERRALSATHWSAWISLATLVVTLVMVIGGAILFNEVRSGKAEVKADAITDTTKDHETRIRALERGQWRVEGKIDDIGKALGVQFQKRQ